MFGLSSARGVTGATGAAGAAGPPNTEVQILGVNTVYTWANQPAADTEFASTPSFRRIASTQGKTLVRIIVYVEVIGAAGAKVTAKGYETVSIATAYASFINLTVGGLLIAIDSSGIKDSGWVALAGSLRDLDAIMVTIGGVSGNGVADPGLYQFMVMFK
jgi:hypothetical protein